MRAGLKSTSEQAAIIARYADLFFPEQLEILREAAQAVTAVDERERLYRLRKTCESGVIAANIAPLQDALQNAELACEGRVRAVRRFRFAPLRLAWASSRSTPTARSSASSRWTRPRS